MHAVKKCLTKRGPSCSRCREGARIIRFVVPMKSSKQVSLWIKKTLKKQNWLYISSTRSQLLIEKLKKDEGYVFLILANHEINLWHTCRPMVDSYLLAIGHSSSKQKKKKKTCHRYLVSLLPLSSLARFLELQREGRGA